MAFKDNVDAESDDEEDMDDLDDMDDELDDYDDDDLAIAGDLELDDAEAERKRKLRKEKMRQKVNRAGANGGGSGSRSPRRRLSETDEEDWQSMGAESLRRASMAMPPQAHSGPSSVGGGADPTGFYNMNHHPAASAKAATSSLRNAPVAAGPAAQGASNNGQIGGREEDAIAALFQLRSYS